MCRDEELWNYYAAIDFPLNEFWNKCSKINNHLLANPCNFNEAYQDNFNTSLNYIIFLIKDESVIEIGVTHCLLAYITEKAKKYGKEVLYSYFKSKEDVSNETYIGLHAINKIDPPMGRILHTNKVFVAETAIGEYFKCIYGKTKHEFNKMKRHNSLTEYGRAYKYYLKKEIDKFVNY